VADLSDQAPWITHDPGTSGSERAKKMARKANRLEYEASFLLPGNVRWNAGQVVSLDSSFGSKFAGNYLITKCIHSIEKGSGYVTHLRMRKTLQGY
jgi:hypothetical protein